MGYYTDFKLEAFNKGAGPVLDVCEKCGGPVERSVFDVIAEETVEAGHVTLDELMAGSLDRMKWYDHEEEMIAISRRYPLVLFTLRGEGEDAGDIWVKHFMGGRIQREKLEVKFPPFDPKKLVDP